MEKDELRIGILNKEIDIITQKINHFDDLRLKTRQMAIVLWVAVIGVGLKNVVIGSGTENNDVQYSGLLYCLASFIPFPFWYLESKYRGYYKKWAKRLSAIRKFIRDGKHILPDGGIAKFQDFIDPLIVDSCFPLFDFWAEKTIKKGHLKCISSLRSGLLSRKIFWIYFPMVLIGSVLSVFELRSEYELFFYFFLALLCALTCVALVLFRKNR